VLSNAASAAQVCLGIRDRGWMSEQAAQAAGAPVQYRKKQQKGASTMYGTKHSVAKSVILLLSALLVAQPWAPAVASTVDRVLPSGSRIYLVTDKEVSSKRGERKAAEVILDVQM
jgi:hypothetical protein